MTEIRAVRPPGALRDALRRLHKALLDAERLDYERSFGRIGSDFYLLQLAAEDPQFAWLRALSTVMLDVDALVASGQDLSATEMRLLATRIRAMLLAGGRMTPFQHRYQRALQEHPEVIMAHSPVIAALPPASAVRIFRGKPPTDIRHYGDLRVHVHHPGEAIPGHGDHGYGPLAVIAESFLPPGTVIPMHEHRNDEIISWVPRGVMRHDDLVHGKLVTDPHLLVMNAGRGFSHAERTLETDPRLRMLQIFVRPRATEMDPLIQHAPLPNGNANTWRHLVGPEGGDAPFTVRNDIELHDIRLDAGARVSLPRREGWDACLFVFEGAVEIDGIPLEASEWALVQSPRPVSLRASDAAIVVAFHLNPVAKVTRAGTIGR
jgi:redox-sensitive bicupin YhaK (pirin superfamily)